MPLETSRVAEIYVPMDGGYGSGYLITPRLVLTARHVFASATSASWPMAPEGAIQSLGSIAAGDERLRCRVRLLSRETGGQFSDAMVVWWDAAHDVALVLVVDGAWRPPAEMAPVAWSDLQGVEPRRCLAVGFPAAEATTGESYMRDSRELSGTIPPASRYKQQRWAIHVDHQIGTVAKTVDSSWSGMSGAAVFVGGAIVGIIETDDDPNNATRLELRALPARLFAENLQFAEWLAADASPQAWMHAPLDIATTEAPPTRRLVLRVPPE